MHVSLSHSSFLDCVFLLLQEILSLFELFGFADKSLLDLAVALWQPYCGLQSGGGFVVLTLDHCSGLLAHVSPPKQPLLLSC